MSIDVAAHNCLGCAEFLPKFSQTCPKSFCATLPTYFSHKDHEEHSFLYAPQKKAFMYFLQTLGSFFEINNVEHHFCLDFQGFCSDIPGF